MWISSVGEVGREESWMGGVIGYVASAYALEKVNSVAVLGFLAEAMLQMTDRPRCSGQSGSNRWGNGGKTVVGL